MRDLIKTLGFPQLPSWLIWRCSGHSFGFVMHEERGFRGKLRAGSQRGLERAASGELAQWDSQRDSRGPLSAIDHPGSMRPAVPCIS